LSLDFSPLGKAIAQHERNLKFATSEAFQLVIKKIEVQQALTF
jgi:hypothetical protein